MAAARLPACIDSLMARYATGDDRAFAPLYRIVAPWLSGHVRRFERCPSAAEDHLQTIFAKLHRLRSTYRLGTPAAPWIKVMATRVCIDAQRKRHLVSDDAALELAAAVVSPEDHIMAGESAARIASALRELPPLQKKAFELVRIEGLDNAAAAARLATTVMAVKLRVHRAACALAAALDTPARVDDARVRRERARHDLPAAADHADHRQVA